MNTEARTLLNRAQSILDEANRLSNGPPLDVKRATSKALIAQGFLILAQLRDQEEKERDIGN